MRKTKNADIIKEASDLLNELEYINFKIPKLVQQLTNTKFTKKKEKELHDIDYLIQSLNIC